VGLGGFPREQAVPMLTEGMWPGLLVRIEEEPWGRAGPGQDKARPLLVLCAPCCPLASHKAMF
jgi:hypothetical protein